MPTDRLQIEAVTQDALRLCVEHVPAVGEPRGAVMVGHAMMANRRSVDRPRGKGLASTLASHGLHVYAYDCRGHGRSLERSPEGSNYRYDDIVRFDLAAVAGLLRTRHPRLPLGGVGHSLTGHAGLAWLGLPEVA
ncbi:MAG: alpha/beta hydrolase, partial [Planctomycetota bacterium]